MASSGILCLRKSARRSSRTTVYTVSKRLRAAAFLSLAAVAGGTAERGSTMGVGEAATGAIIVGRKTIKGTVERLVVLNNLKWDEDDGLFLSRLSALAPLPLPSSVSHWCGSIVGSRLNTQRAHPTCRRAVLPSLCFGRAVPCVKSKLSFFTLPASSPNKTITGNDVVHYMEKAPTAVFSDIRRPQQATSCVLQFNKHAFGRNQVVATAPLRSSSPRIYSVDQIFEAHTHVSCLAFLDDLVTQSKSILGISHPDPQRHSLA